VRVEGDIVQIDRRGSYCSAYVQFQGIPKGVPMVMEKIDPSEWDYFYICVEVNTFRHRSRDDPYPALKRAGLRYLDKELFDYINAHYDWDYRWKSGVGFNQGFNTQIRDTAAKLWQLRMELKAEGSPLQAVVKRLINTLWGKSVEKDCFVYKRDVHVGRLLDTLRFNRRFILGFKMTKDHPDLYQVQFVKPVCASYTHPQFGVNVLSWSLVSMHSLIDVMPVCEVFYTNTDCLVLKRDKAEELNRLHNGNLIGTELGQMDFEFPETAKKFICLSAKKYIFCFTNGEFKVRLGPKGGDPEAYFERKYREQK
jgi:hypothetical protein